MKKTEGYLIKEKCAIEYLNMPFDIRHIVFRHHADDKLSKGISEKHCSDSSFHSGRSLIVESDLKVWGCQSNI